MTTILERAAHSVYRMSCIVIFLLFVILVISHFGFEGGGVAQWLGRRISDQGVPGSNPGRCSFRCGLEQVTFTLLSTG